MNLKDISDKAIPPNAPHWVRKHSLSTVSTIVTTLAAAVGIFAWLGIKPAQPLELNEAYVTHQQFNMLMINMVKSVENIERELGSIKSDVEKAKEMSVIFDEMNEALESGAPEETRRGELPENEPVVEEIVVAPPEPKTRLKNAVESIGRLQMEQRVLRR